MIGRLEMMYQRARSHNEQGIHTVSRISLKKLFSSLSYVFAFSLSSSGKGLNFVTAIPLHPACLSEFPLVAVSIYFTSLYLLGEVLAGIS